MSSLSEEMLIKSLGLNIFYPRALINPPEASSLVLFARKPSAEYVCYLSADLDELGYMRRYSKQRLFYECSKPTRKDVIEASVYGCDGILFEECSKQVHEVIQGAGLMSAAIIKSKKQLLMAVAKRFNILIGANSALPEGFLTGRILREDECNI